MWTLPAPTAFAAPRRLDTAGQGAGEWGGRAPGVPGDASPDQLRLRMVVAGLGGVGRALRVLDPALAHGPSLLTPALVADLERLAAAFPWATGDFLDNRVAHLLAGAPVGAVLARQDIREHVQPGSGTPGARRQGRLVAAAMIQRMLDRSPAGAVRVSLVPGAEGGSVVGVADLSQPGAASYLAAAPLRWDIAGLQQGPERLYLVTDRGAPAAQTGGFRVRRPGEAWTEVAQGGRVRVPPGTRLVLPDGAPGGAIELTLPGAAEPIVVQQAVVQQAVVQQAAAPLVASGLARGPAEAALSGPGSQPVRRPAPGYAAEVSIGAAELWRWARAEVRVSF